MVRAFWSAARPTQTGPTMRSTIQTLTARFLVYLAVAAAPADKAKALEDAARLIWRPKQ